MRPNTEDATLHKDGRTIHITGPEAFRLAWKLAGWRRPRFYFLAGVLAGTWLGAASVWLGLILGRL